MINIYPKPAGFWSLGLLDGVLGKLQADERGNLVWRGTSRRCPEDVLKRKMGFLKWGTPKSWDYDD